MTSTSIRHHVNRWSSRSIRRPHSRAHRLQRTFLLRRRPTAEGSTPLWQPCLRGTLVILAEQRRGPMIKDLTDLPAGVIGFEIAGTLRAEDYRDVVLPAL